MYCDGQTDVSHTQSESARVGMSTPCPVNSRTIHCRRQKAVDWSGCFVERGLSCPNVRA